MAVFDTGDGVLGIEGLWTWNGSFDLNDREATAYFDISKAVGLHSGAEYEPSTSKKVGRIGMNFHPTSPGGKTIVLEGKTKADSLPLMRAFGRTMRSHFSRVSSLGYMEIAPHADLGGPTARFYAQPMTPEIDDVQAYVRWVRSPVIGFRLYDPRIYWPSLAVDTTGSPAAVTNIGIAPADPILTLAGASGTVVVSDGTHALTFINVPSGSLVIDFSARTAKVGAVNCQLNVAASNWWDSHVDGIAPGASVSISETGATSVRVQFTPAD